MNLRYLSHMNQLVSQIIGWKSNLFEINLSIKGKTIRNNQSISMNNQ